MKRTNEEMKEELKQFRLLIREYLRLQGGMK